MKLTARSAVVAITVLFAAPALAEAGPPLLCHPFQVSNAALLPWAPSNNWDSPDRSYDVSKLTSDTLRLLSPDAPVLARMENMRRAVIYVLDRPKLADELIAAVVGRVGSAPDKDRPALLFDAGYILETYKQGSHRHKRTDVRSGYDMVVRAASLTKDNSVSAEMEFAASLMTEGAKAREHVRRARTAAVSDSLLARNIDVIWR